MIPGDSFTKTFTVENTSNRTVDFNIYLQNITNEFNDDLVYALNDDTGSVVGVTPLPVTNKDKSYLKTKLDIDSNTTKTYTLTVTFKNTEEPQNDYQGKTFKGTLGIDTELITYDIDASEVQYSNENTECTDISCSLNELYERINGA